MSNARAARLTPSHEKTEDRIQEIEDRMQNAKVRILNRERRTAPCERRTANCGFEELRAIPQLALRNSRSRGRARLRGELRTPNFELRTLNPRRRAELAVFTIKLSQKQLRYGIEGCKNILTSFCYRLKTLHPSLPVVQEVFKIVGRSDVLKVALIELQDIWKLVKGYALSSQVLLKISEAVDIFLHLIPLRIRYENDGVDVAQYELACGVIDDLAWDSEKLKLCFKSLEDFGM